MAVAAPHAPIDCHPRCSPVLQKCVRSYLYCAFVFAASSFDLESQFLLGCQLPDDLRRSLRGVLLAGQRTEAADDTPEAQSDSKKEMGEKS